MMEFSHTLNLDLETKSDVDLKKRGMYRYIRHRSFRVLVLCYSFDGKPVQTVDIANGENIPGWLIAALQDKRVKKMAWNATFERTCLSEHLGIPLSAGDNWEDTAVKAAMLGFPGSLDATAKALGTTMQKAGVGKALMRIFSIGKYDKQGNIYFGDPRDPALREKWEQYKDYCAQDVYTEMEIAEKLRFFIIPDVEERMYILDQDINDRGFYADPVLICNAIKHSAIYTNALLEEAKQLTALGNPKSVKQLTEWLELEIQDDIPSLKKDAVINLIANAPTEKVKRVLQIRQQISKTSVKKFDALLGMLCEDGRAHGMFKFYGANRTGRWSGQIFQPQNLYKNDLPDIDELRELECAGDFDNIDMCFNTAEALAQLIRTSLTARPGSRLYMSDFAAIEARVLAWLAVEMWKLEVFKGDGKIYEAVGSKMFNVPISAVTKKSHYRQRAKIMELLCGYGGGVDAVLRNPANRELGTDAEIKSYVDQWRAANPRICTFWKEVEKLAKHTIQTGQTMKLRNLTFYMRGNIFHIILPSGRSLSYLNAVVKPVAKKFKKEVKDEETGEVKIVEEIKVVETIFYAGVDQQTKRWVLTSTYGGKLVENIVQGTSRDLLAWKMIQLDDAGFEIVGHVHDEVVIDEPLPDLEEEIDAIMCAGLSWTKGLPLRADTYSSPFYKKES